MQLHPPAVPAPAPEAEEGRVSSRPWEPSSRRSRSQRKRSSRATAAKRRYTDKRKVKLGELRALKSKRIREFNTKSKKLPKAERLKQRREYKKKVEAQFKEMQTRFPTARGLKSVGVLRELIRKLDAFRAAR